MDFHGNENLRATELRLGLPGTPDDPPKQSPPANKSNKRGFLEMASGSRSERSESGASNVDNRESTVPPT
ncbi:hypothetical protein CRG98_015507, partial [Punica granatum]